MPSALPVMVAIWEWQMLTTKQAVLHKSGKVGFSSSMLHFHHNWVSFLIRNCLFVCFLKKPQCVCPFSPLASTECGAANPGIKGRLILAAGVYLKGRLQLGSSLEHPTVTNACH